jgi:PAS domain-containing protein
MSSTNGDNDSMSKSIDSFQRLGWQTLRQLYGMFSKLWTPVQLLLAAVGLAVAVYYGNALRLSLLNTHASVAMALAAKLEPNRTIDQGVSAFLLSGIKDDWTKPENLNIPVLNPILQELNSKVQEEAAKAISESAGESNAANKGSSDSASSAVRRTIEKLDLKVDHTGSPRPWQTWQTAIVSRRENFFMVVPDMSLRRKDLDEPPLGGNTPGDQSRLVAALKHNPEILFDLNLASELEPIMRKLDTGGSERLTIVQTYFITESGVFLIRANGVTDHARYYGREFQPYTQYMDRPYFWGAVDLKDNKYTPFDYATKPYLDLGGHGFVVTFSKKFDLPNRRVGVLCVDAKLPEEVTGEVMKHIESLGATVSDFYWVENKGLEPGTDGPLPPEFSWFEDQLRKSREARSLVLGTIATEPSKASPSESRTVRFTVPIASSDYESGYKKTRLLRVEFDSSSVLKRLTKSLALFTAGIILVIAVTWSLFWDYTVLKREMSNVLEKMSIVMRDASTPFVWLNERNEFVKVNRAMLKLLGHENIEELRKQSPTFKGLVTDETQPIYDGVLKVSGTGKETGEYKISIITKSGKVLHVRAHGERIPYPTWLRRGLPHRFGIFVEVIESDPQPGQPPSPLNVTDHKSSGDACDQVASQSFTLS